MIGPGSILSNFRCPNCGTFQPSFQMWRTNPWRGPLLFPQLEFHVCRTCQVHLKLSNEKRWVVGCLLLPTAIFSSFTALWMLLGTSSFTYVDDSGTTELTFAGGVLLCFAGIYLPAQLLRRLFKLEIVE
ncbi:hypothetical protein [Falsiruegeria mediterranea]|uniref:Cxxc_20_cxxc protein n=1 Tax=Falsiruegeria mediterranea M17 TaxID=1200281 RepID=A0A2R8C4F8_9RHOB|nr:hypothetical protein [Falsiruegeria mediterranea]SPJ27318.1 hypothetical protein TRM7615_00802 [Falsiruegeria mediterranea M17]